MEWDLKIILLFFISRSDSIRRNPEVACADLPDLDFNEWREKKHHGFPHIHFHDHFHHLEDNTKDHFDRFKKEFEFYN